MVSEGEAFNPTPANIEGRVQRTKLANGMKLVMLPKKNRGGTVYVQIGLQFGDEKSSGQELRRAACLWHPDPRHENKSRQQIQDESDRLKARIGGNGGTRALAPASRRRRRIWRGRCAWWQRFCGSRRWRKVRWNSSANWGLRQSKTFAANQNSSAARNCRDISTPIRRTTWRYAAMPDERVAEMKKVTIDQVKQFYAQVLRRLQWRVHYRRPVRSGRSEENWPPSCSAIGKVPPTSSSSRTRIAKGRRGRS